ncbi:hypothetical protein QBC39DRAFT_117092 [Podospora conica]|nr:hypothetical protein QBC39DRAFT_117092 [Schizothecium conicum]
MWARATSAPRPFGIRSDRRHLSAAKIFPPPHLVRSHLARGRGADFPYISRPPENLRPFFLSPPNTKKRKNARRRAARVASPRSSDFNSGHLRAINSSPNNNAGAPQEPPAQGPRSSDLKSSNLQAHKINPPPGNKKARRCTSRAAAPQGPRSSDFKSGNPQAHEINSPPSKQQRQRTPRAAGAQQNNNPAKGNFPPFPWTKHHPQAPPPSTTFPHFHIHFHLPPPHLSRQGGTTHNAAGQPYCSQYECGRLA